MNKTNNNIDNKFIDAIIHSILGFPEIEKMDSIDELLKNSKTIQINDKINNKP